MHVCKERIKDRLTHELDRGIGVYCSNCVEDSGERANRISRPCRVMT